MPIYLSGLLWVIVAAAAAAVLAYLVRRFGETHGTRDNNEAAGQVFTIVCGLQAVIIAFVLITLFDKSSAAEDSSFREANGLIATVWAADSLPEAVKAQVRPLARAYTDEVIKKEWPQLRDGADVPADGWAKLDQMRAAIASAGTDGDWQADRKKEATSQLWQVY